MDTPHGGTGEDRSSNANAKKSTRYASPFEPKFINRAPRSFGRRKTTFAPAVFQPAFARSLERLRHNCIDATNAARTLTTIHVVICLPEIAAAMPRPRAFGFGLRKSRSPFASIRGLRFLEPRAGAEHAVPFVIERGVTMRGPVIASLDTLTLDEALTYLDAAEGDELVAATELGRDRNLLDGSTSEPYDTEIHHALFMLRRARGLAAPSFDTMRVQLRRLQAA